jgi:hypothetical protein
MVRAVYLSIDKNVYYFFSYDTNPNDGSLYLFLGSKKQRRISYHSTGRVNYKKIPRLPDSLDHSFFEPLYQTTAKNIFFSLKMTSHEKLDPFRGTVKEEDFVFQIPFVTRTMSFHFVVLPASSSIDSSGFSLRFGNLFSLMVLCEGNDVSDEIFPNFGFSQNYGLEKQAIDKDTALISFHKRANNANNSILYSCNAEGDYKLIFETPMFRPPDVSVRFANPGHRIEKIFCSKSMLRFKVKDESNQTIKDAAIIELALDARL